MNKSAFLLAIIYVCLAAPVSAMADTAFEALQKSANDRVQQEQVSSYEIKNEREALSRRAPQLRALNSYIEKHGGLVEDGECFTDQVNWDYVGGVGLTFVFRPGRKVPLSSVGALKTEDLRYCDLNLNNGKACRINFYADKSVICYHNNPSQL